MKNLVFIDANNASIQSMDEAMRQGFKVTFLRQSNVALYQNNSFTQSVLSRLDNIIDMENGTDADELVRLLNTILRDDVIDGVIAPLELSLEAVAEACQRCNIPFTNLQGIKNARDKRQARTILQEQGVPTIRSWVAHTIEEARAIFTQYTPPFIFKPVSGCDSWYTVKVSTPEQVEAASADILNAAPPGSQTYQNIFSRGILIEEFLQGTLLSAEVGIYNGTFYEFMISGRCQSRFNECIELGSLMPAAINPEQRKACFHYAKAVCAALGLDYGIFHIEIMYTANGPILVEANSRLMGGVMPEIYRQATGVSVYPALFTIATQADTSIALPAANRAVTVRKVMPLDDGITAPEFTTDDIRTHPNIVNFYSDKLTPARKVAKNEVLGRIMVSHPNLDEANKIADTILSDIERRIGVEIHQPL
ncbi:ATP-grasp domain-containing protein [Lonsdalea quercina]|uniref:ATP-grasp domain-containing protein n=1 Tax=Lonsdalea quercina TaxID=71657 RepID=UPI003976AF68